MLALAQGDVFLDIHGELNRFKPGSFVCPVTKRLVSRSSTRTPVVGSWFQRHHRRFFRSYAWLPHEHSSLRMVEMRSRG